METAPNNNQKAAKRYFTNGSPVTERGTRRALNTTILSGVFGNAWQAVIIGVPYQMYLAVLNASGALIGLASTICSLTMILQLPGSFLAERLKERRPLVVIVATLQRLLWFIPAFMPLITKDASILTMILIGVVVTSAALGNCISGSSLAWTADLVPVDKAGNYWGRRMLSVMPVYLGTTFLAGYVLDLLPTVWKDLPLLGFMVVFFAAGVSSMIEMYWQWRTPEVVPERPDFSKNPLERIIIPLQNRDFLLLTLGYSFWFFVNSIFNAFSFIFLRQVYGVSYHVIAFIAAASTLGTVVFGQISGYIIDRLSARNYVICCFIIEPILTLYWFFLYPGAVVSFHLPYTGFTFAISQPVFILLIGQFLFGALTNGVFLAQMALIGVHAPRHDRSVAIAVHNCIIGAIAAMGPLLAGFFIDFIKDFHLNFLGADWHYMQLLAIVLAVVVWGVVLPFFFRLKKLDNELRFRDAASRLLFYNPFRIMRSMYHIFTINSSTDEALLAEAVEELGEENAAIAVKDLIEKMSDPSYEVREAAAKALGAIGSDDAIKAILTLLEDEDIDLPITLIRALRKHKSLEAVPLLTEKLDSQNPFIQREAARTLGVLGDVSAIPRLRELLKITENASVATAASIALAKLGCHDALKDVWHQYLQTENQTLRKEMTLALAEMLIPGGHFYQTLSKEEKNFASQAEKLVATFSWSVICLAERLSSSQTPGRTHHQNVLLAANQKEKAKQLLTAYESDTALSALLCWSIARELAFMRFNIEPPKTKEQLKESGYLENLYDCDERFGLGIWLIYQINVRARLGNHITSQEILVPLFFLANWTRAEATKP